VLATFACRDRVGHAPVPLPAWLALVAAEVVVPAGALPAVLVADVVAPLAEVASGADAAGSFGPQPVARTATQARASTGSIRRAAGGENVMEVPPFR